MAVPLLHKHREHTYIHTCARVKARPKVHRKFPFKWVIQITRLSEMTPRLLWWSKNRPFAFTCTFNSFSSLRPSFLYIQLLCWLDFSGRWTRHNLWICMSEETGRRDKCPISPIAKDSIGVYKIGLCNKTGILICICRQINWRKLNKCVQTMRGY